MNDKANFFNFFFDSGNYEELKVERRIADFFPALVFIYDTDSGNVVYGNRRFKEFSPVFNGVPGSYALFSHLIFKADIAVFQNALEVLNKLEAHGSFTFKCRFADTQTKYRYFRNSGTVLNKRDDKAVTILFLSEDITDEVKREREMQMRLRLFEETEQMLEYGTWTYHPRSGALSWTSGLYTLLGYDKSEIPQNIKHDFFMKHVLPEYADDFEKNLRTAITERSSMEFEYTVKTKSGELKNVFTKARVIVDFEDSLTVVGTTRDITLLRNFEKEQERHLHDLNRSNKALEEFAYVASHDLQEPVRKIAMFSERLRSKYSDMIDREGLLFIDRIVGAADNMKMLIDNLLEFSRANRSSEAFAPVNLQDVFQQVITNLELKIEETKSTISISGLPTIEAVGSEMEQLFSNLISNSIKFRRPSMIPHIEITGHQATVAEKTRYALPDDRTFHVIEVKDNGIGFEEEYTEKIFQIFHRLHGKAEYPGSGIGLAICKRIVDNHNGIIAARSLPGCGSTFTVILPEKQF
jgi:signal transduction histidine kinase